MPPISANVSTSVASKSGDAASGLQAPLQYNGQFIIGGSGGARGTTEGASNSAADGTGVGIGGNNIILYVGLGIIGLIGLAVLARR